MAVSNCTSGLGSVVLAINSLPRFIGLTPEILNTSNGSSGTSVSFTTGSIWHAWFWGAVIMIVSVAILLPLCVFYCCVCCCVCCREDDDGYTRKTYKCPKISCALFTVTMIVSSIILLCVSIWLETQVDNGVTMFSTFLENNSTSVSSASAVGSQARVLVEIFEFYRFRVALALLSVSVFILLLSLFAFCCAPACKSPAAIVVFMIFHVLLALVLSIYAGVTFALVVFGSDLCVGTYTLLCELNTQLLISSPALEVFCTKVVVDGFTTVILTCTAILILYLLQVFSSVYAKLVRKSNYSEVVTVGQSSEMFISTPLTVGGTRFHGGVWDAYGAQSVMGVKSRGQDIPSGYTPEAYPMGVVAPVAPVAPIPPQESNGMKEATLRVQELEGSPDSSNDLRIVDV